MKFDTTYYHGLAGGIPFWCQEEILKESLKTLKSILELGGIYCRNELKKYGINYDEKKAVYNGDDYISVCIENPGHEEFAGRNFGLDSAFFRYVKNKIAIEFNLDIVKNCIFRDEPYERLPGERQILKFIDISNFSRILVGVISLDLQSEANEEIKKICGPYNIPVVTFKEKEELMGNQKRLLK